MTARTADAYAAFRDICVAGAALMFAAGAGASAAIFFEGLL